MADAPEYRFGRIIWAYLRPSSKDRRKQLHPAVIISPDSEIVQPDRFDPRKNPLQENSVAVVGVSTKFRNYPALEHFVVPFHTSGHLETKLKSECAVIIGWYDIVAIDDEVVDKAGQVPTALMAKIDAAVRADITTRLGRESEGLGRAVRQLLYGD